MLLFFTITNRTLVHHMRMRASESSIPLSLTSHHFHQPSPSPSPQLPRHYCIIRYLFPNRVSATKPRPPSYHLRLCTVQSFRRTLVGRLRRSRGHACHDSGLSMCSVIECDKRMLPVSLLNALALARRRLFSGRHSCSSSWQKSCGSDPIAVAFSQVHPLTGSENVETTLQLCINQGLDS
ncbi:hypothetical protein HS088_TW11G00178 [Tripterygium wilfordii]|uniref:Uncharacterized protein n=1 Tax=Tripterygium wilfordii TaxID=458696 RepID=A0A7J7D1B2_TRIWF|nr:uncharacterized protein LOC120009008 isoform X2 [Tripterygium wilfordii]KAF5740113.1 hypothetical protein HS088_TW11G00178 [Tripterygium wilfordii]